MTERSSLDRRSFFDRRNLSPREAECLRLCRLAGAYFAGIQPGFGSIPDQILFQRSAVATTLCLPVDERLTAKRIAYRLSASERIAASLERRRARAAFGMRFDKNPANSTEVRTAVR